MERLLERIRLGLDRLDVVALERVAHLADRRLDLRLRTCVDLVAQLAELLLRLVGGVVGGVAGLGQLALACCRRRRATRRP